MSKVIFTITSALKQDLDHYCDKKNYSRSEFIRYAIRQVIYPIKKEKTNESTFGILGDEI